MNDIERKARHLLAAAMRDGGFQKLSDQILMRDEVQEHNHRFALNAIIAALTPPEGPATHYNCADGIYGTVRRLRTYSKQGDNRNSLQGQTMEEAAAYIEHVLAARPEVSP